MLYRQCVCVGGGGVRSDRQTVIDRISPPPITPPLVSVPVEFDMFHMISSRPMFCQLSGVGRPQEDDDDDNNNYKNGGKQKKITKSASVILMI